MIPQCWTPRTCCRSVSHVCRSMSCNWKISWQTSSWWQVSSNTVRWPYFLWLAPAAVSISWIPKAWQSSQTSSCRRPFFKLGIDVCSYHKLQACRRGMFFHRSLVHLFSRKTVRHLRLVGCCGNPLRSVSWCCPLIMVIIMQRLFEHSLNPFSACVFRSQSVSYVVRIFLVSWVVRALLCIRLMWMYVCVCLSALFECSWCPHPVREAACYVWSWSIVSGKVGSPAKTLRLPLGTAVTALAADERSLWILCFMCLHQMNNSLVRHPYRKHPV